MRFFFRFSKQEVTEIQISMYNTFLVHAKAGYEATRAIELEYSYRVRDFSHNYRGYSDLNDYLCGRKQEQKNEGITPASHFRRALSVSEIQRLRRLMREGSPERISRS